ncbi:hypothetical protein WEI85_00660 [Actinomycetes bacterium KLBMP 9797]
MIEPIDRAKRIRLAGPTRLLGTFTAYGWFQLATEPTNAFSTFDELTYLAVLHHADHTTVASDGYRGSHADDLVAFTGLTAPVLARCLSRLADFGWLHTDQHGRYLPTSAVFTFARGGLSRDGLTVICIRCLAETPRGHAHRHGAGYIGNDCCPGPTPPGPASVPDPS